MIPSSRKLTDNMMKDGLDLKN